MTIQIIFNDYVDVGSPNFYERWLIMLSNKAKPENGGIIL